MTRYTMLLAALVGVLVISVVPDYIGLGFGFWSFLAHKDLTQPEIQQFGWLAAYCGAMAVLMIAMSTAVVLCFARLAPRIFLAGTVLSAVIVALAALHLSIIYQFSGVFEPKASELFVSAAERHAWTAFAAGLLALLLFSLQMRVQPGSSVAADAPTSQ